ncbi:MAG: ABC transporter ATP-binding protein [Sinobacterium sp.]|nr:ABC transporter ATP-binding protein [Sinobacterium sp.]
MTRILAWFESKLSPFSVEHPKQPPNSLVKFCLHYVKDAKWQIFFLSLSTAILAVSEVSLYAILGQLVDWLSHNKPETFLSENLSVLIALSLFILLFIPCMVFVHSALLHQIFMGNLPMRIRWMAHRYLLGQSWGFYQQEFSGRVATKVMQTALAVRDAILKVVDVLLFITVYLICTIILVASLDYYLSIPLILWACAYFSVLRFFLPRLRRISMVQADSRSEMTGRIVDSYTNIQTLKLFSDSNADANYVKESMSEFLSTVHPQMRLVTYLNVSVWCVNMCLIFSIAALGLYFWSHSAMTPAAIAVAMSIAIRITGMSHWIMWEVSNLFESIGVVKDGLNTLSTPYSVVDADGASQMVVDQATISFEQVNFSYNKQSTVFKNFNLNVAAGEKVGIVGRSGAGKSTLVNLLLRFYNLDSGVIKLDGKNISEVTQDSLRKQLAVVSQDTSLLHRSVFENIAIAKPDASFADVELAVKQAKADVFISNLEDTQGRRGFDAHVGERGVTLSGGQRQRIAIARALLKNAPVLILDEATSALDSEVEASIQENLQQLMQHKTVIAIAHRLSTIAQMDRLIVMDCGEIIEQGSHDELLVLGGVYASLWNKQAGGFIAE